MHPKKRKVILTIALFIFFIILLAPGRNAPSFYSYIVKEDILKHLHFEVASYYSTELTNLCDYSQVINDVTSASIESIKLDIIDVHKIKKGGEYQPSDCQSRFSVAIIVPYRDRAEQLHTFLNYMHKYLRRQKIHYRIFVIEQLNHHLFNRATLINIGVTYAIKHGFPCIIMHDVDLLPEKVNNIYVCTEQPRHMSNSINKFRYNLPYVGLCGGAFAILTKDFIRCNGMSNMYQGWGGEDDDFYIRLAATRLELYRFDPTISRYSMLHHKSEYKSDTRATNKRLLNNAVTRIRLDGLNSLNFTEISVVLHPLFTHVMVDFKS